MKLTKEKLKELVKECIDEMELEEAKNKGLWHNIHKRRKKGLPKRKPGDKNYPKTLDIDEDFGMSARQLPTFSSKEAKKVLDDSVRQYASLLRKAEAKIIKDWMSKAKAGVIDYFDIVRGLETGDISRAYKFEMEFLKGILNRDKIMNRFKSYFGGKKGKPGYRGPS